MHIAATYLGPDVRHDAWIYEGPSGGRLAVIATIRSGNAVGEARRRGRLNLDVGKVDVSRLLSGWDGWLLREGVTEVWRRRSSFVVVPYESGKVRMVAKRSGRRLC